MLTHYEAMLEHFRGLHAEVLKALDALPPEALDWSPGADMNSISVLTMHICGAERYWIGDVVRGDPSFRDRESEFHAKGMEVAALKRRVEDLDAFEAAAFDTLRLRDLDARKVSPRDGCQVTVGWALLHALQHTALHVGHIEILTQQWKQREKA
jgi:uncharacterized damage-inducible protein DinB